MTTTAEASLHRIEVRRTKHDPKGEAIVRDARALGIDIGAASATRVYLIETSEPLGEDDLGELVDKLFTDPVIERAEIGASPAMNDGGNARSIIEVHPLPGVMDPAGASVRDAIAELIGIDAKVSTGWRYDLQAAPDDARRLAERLLANTVIHAIHDEPFLPDRLPEGHARGSEVTHIAIRDLDDAALEKLSREAHLFLSLDEMRAIRDEYRKLKREPTDIELETLAQTWSEHCVHKTLKATVQYREGRDGGEERHGGTEARRHEGGGLHFHGRPGHVVNADGSVTISNLLKSTVAAATHELIAEDAGIRQWCLSVFVDNAGIIGFDDETAVCVKVETHNHPSAIEPYGGAATGIGGCIRDIIGTGLAAKPIASTDVFCVGTPDIKEVPPGCLHPRRILTQVVAGVRDYGNRMGIPTVNGAVAFDDDYVGNPLVFCGCIGVMPRTSPSGQSLVSGSANPGDLIVALGGRTGRDGIHGATFSSAELTDTHADEFSHAVQIGNAIEEKRVLDAILRARDENPEPLYTGITDCGAGGFSSAVGEMGEQVGAEVHLERAPLKYDGLTYTEIWISEAQERMVLSVPRDNLDALQRICDEEGVELAVLGTFGVKPEHGDEHGPELVLNFHGQEVGRLPMHFLHDGIPMPVRAAVWEGRHGGTEARRHEGGEDVGSTGLLQLLAHPNIASKHFIIRQYDHEVQGNTAVKPLVGARGVGPSDAAVIEPVAGAGKGLAIACGLGMTKLGAGDPYHMALNAIDECVRNLVCVGADPDHIAILDNFCWPSCNKPENLGALVRACEGCYDGAKAYRTPFISGKDSLNNQFTTEAGRTIEIPYTLLITGVGEVPDVGRCVTSDIKRAGSRIILVESIETDEPLGARVSAARTVAKAIAGGAVLSAHDVSDGGVLCALAEMLIGGQTDDSPIGARLELPEQIDPFAERPGRYLLEIAADGELSAPADVALHELGRTNDSARLVVEGADVDLPITDLERAWRATLDW